MLDGWPAGRIHGISGRMESKSRKGRAREDRERERERIKPMEFSIDSDDAKHTRCSDFGDSDHRLRHICS